ncbi:AAA family ATPase [Polyangium fumosum]|uniref:ATP-binding protein n=1 Tax=Polyangium fumosum TaxID=889272 RepID=A0A4U1IGC2_9BACT|nr:ATP-binding protein [Polyangium fumosum]TKC92737.1 ATP-binding protein [Polyangium fumosum]
MDDASLSPSQPPALGERRAIGGYQPQYRFAAKLILKKLRDGTLVWLRVADPNAGRLDDLQIADQGCLDAYQVKWSRFPGSFTFNELTKPGPDAPCLIAQLADGWKRLRAQNPGRRVVVHLVTNDLPSTRDRLPGASSGGALHFAAFIAECWLPKACSTSGVPIPEHWTRAWADLVAASKLTSDEFDRFTVDCQLDFGTAPPDTITSPAATDGLPTITAREVAAWKEDLDALNLVLFKLVADPRQIIEVSRERLLHELGWRERAEFRHRHDFPEPSIPYQTIRETVDELESAIRNHAGGYLLVLGSPGSGKSTLLTQTMRYRPERVVRYYAYVPDSLEPNARRGESINFFHDLTLELDRQGFRAGDSLARADLDLLTYRFQEQLRRLGEDFQQTGRKTIIMVDGLDHIAREQSPQRALLKDMPAPAGVPDGVYIILGSQTDELSDLARPVRIQLREPSRRVIMRRLPRASVVEAVSRAELVPMPAADDVDRIFELSNGHPLALAYLLNRIQRSKGMKITEILDAVEPFNERIDEQYEAHWLAIEEDRVLVHLLALLARVRGAMDSAWIEQWANSDALYRLGRFDHYFRHEAQGRRYFFHNSFRAFLLRKTRALPGVSSSGGDAPLYRELAECCARLPETSCWRWDELHYRAHAGDYEAVLALAIPETFRAQFMAGRPIDAIQADIHHSIQAAARQGDIGALARTVLAASEHQYREFNIRELPIFSLLVALDRPTVAADHIRDGNRLRVTHLKALQACEVLAKAGMKIEAERIFNLAEPHEVLSGVQPEEHKAREANELLEAWINTASWFRPILQLLDLIARLQRGEDRARQHSAAEATRELRSLLRFRLAEKLRDQKRWDEFVTVVTTWRQDDDADWAWLFWSHFHAWRETLHGGDRERATSFFNRIVSMAEVRTLAVDERFALAEGFLRVCNDRDAAAKMLNGLSQPPLASLGAVTDHEGFEPFVQRFRLNRLLAVLGDTRPLREIVPDVQQDEDQVLVFFERQVVHVARLWGYAWSGRILSPSSFMLEAHPIIRLLGQRPEPGGRSWLARWLVFFAADTLPAARPLREHALAVVVAARKTPAT